MIDSAARAERFDPAPSISPFYTWEVPQKPVLVRLPLVFIDRLEREVVEAFRSVSSLGSEIGGILWGTVDPGEPLELSLVEYDLVPCDYARGPLYRLADADLARVDRALAQRGGSGLRPVGFFRSHTRKGLTLDADDLSLMDSRFSEPHHIALVIHPYATKPSTAGVFIRENGAIQGETSHLEFPFRSAQLAPAKHLADVVDPAANPPVPPATPKPAVRAQIVPIASRRDISAVAPPLAVDPVAAPIPVVQPQPQALDKPAPQPLAQPVAQPLPQPVAQAAPPPVVQVQPQPVEKPAPQPVEKLEKPPAEKPAASPAVQATAPAAPQFPEPVEPEPPAHSIIDPPQAAPVAASEPTPEPETPLEVEEPAAAAVAEPARTRGVTKLIWFAVGAIFPLLLSGVLFIYPGVLRHANLPAISGQDSSPLALRAERSGSELLLTWNNDSSAIRNATRAVLSISDGEQHENVEMDLSQLRNGRIEYLPVTGDVVFRMEVSGKDNAKTVSESVRVLRTRPSPMPQDSDPSIQNGKSAPPNAAPASGSSNTTATNGTAANPPASNSAAASTPASGTPTPEATPANTPASTPSAPLKPFNTASLSERLRPVRSDDIALPDAPAAGRGDGMTASDAALRLTAVAPPPPPMARKADVPAAPPSKPAAVPTGGEVQQAQLIYRKPPEYPGLARSAGVKGAVELVATIGPNGRVKSVKVVKGHPLLQKAAVDAVMQWQYKPTMLNGHPVETETAITLNFVSDR